MPYGLACMPSAFQCLINDVLHYFLGKVVIAYIDDILTHSPSEESHVSHVSQVLKKLRQKKLYVLKVKCEFHVNTVAFLGYIISTDAIAINENKDETVRDWPIPRSVKKLQRFLGFANFYQRFIRNLSIIAVPVSTLLKGKTKLIMWNSAADKVSQQLKQAFTSAPILKHPDLERPFVVEVDV